MWLRTHVLTVGALLSVLVPAAWGQADHVEGTAWQKIDDRCRLSASDDARYEQQPSELDLHGGAVLIETQRQCPVKTQLSYVEPRRHALVFIRTRKGCEHIFVLLGHADVKVGSRLTSLNAGEEAVVADHDPSETELLGQDYIGRRRLRLDPLSQGRSVGVAEFSLVQAVEREPLVYRLIHSSDPHDRSLKERLYKTATVLYYVTGTHGQYVTGPR